MRHVSHCGSATTRTRRTEYFLDPDTNLRSGHWSLGEDLVSYFECVIFLFPFLWSKWLTARIEALELSHFRPGTFAMTCEILPSKLREVFLCQPT